MDNKFSNFRFPSEGQLFPLQLHSCGHELSLTEKMASNVLPVPSSSFRMIGLLIEVFYIFMLLIISAILVQLVTKYCPSSQERPAYSLRTEVYSARCFYITTQVLTLYTHFNTSKNYNVSVLVM